MENKVENKKENEFICLNNCIIKVSNIRFVKVKKHTITIIIIPNIKVKVRISDNYHFIPEEIEDLINVLHLHNYKFNNGKFESKYWFYEACV